MGAALSRTEAKRAVAGRGRWAGDVSLPDMLHAAFVRSPFAHAKILEIDTAAGGGPSGVPCHNAITPEEILAALAKI
jgi:carbon-monoxide dehydrogenase large subunit